MTFSFKLTRKEVPHVPEEVALVLDIFNNGKLVHSKPFFFGTEITEDEANRDAKAYFNAYKSERSHYS